MCFEHDSLPPIPAIEGGAVAHEDLVLEAADGNRFAERGIPALAIDYFGRTAGVGKRGEDFGHPEHVAQTTPEGIGAVGFYGQPKERDSSGPTQRAAVMECPILALQAGDDQNITAEDNAAFEQALTEAGVEHELVTYEGAPHGFFDRKQEQFADALADAWERVLRFVDKYG